MITTVVGSYPRLAWEGKPNRLRKAINDYQSQKISAEELKAAEDATAEEVLREQIDVGLDLVTDGQVRWEDNLTYFARRIEGFEINGLVRYFDTNVYFRQPVAVAPVKWSGPMTVEDYRFAVAIGGEKVKPVITGPYTVATLSQDNVYGEKRAFVLDLARIFNRELEALVEAGATFVQVDEPAIVRHKDEFDLFAEAMTILTDVVQATTALYTYFGDMTGVWKESQTLPFDVLGLDCVGGPENLELLLKEGSDRAVALGLLNARNTKLEDVEELLPTLERVSAVVEADRIYLNPSCGLEFLPREQAFRKAERTVEAARAFRNGMALS